MRKRIIALVLAVVLMLSLGCLLTACGKKGECEVCGETKTLKKITIEGESGWVCNDCYKLIKSLGSLF